MTAERKRLALGLLLSLFFHALLLSLTFSGEGVGLPGLGFPWQDRRIEAPDSRDSRDLRELRAVLAPKPAPSAEPARNIDQALDTVLDAAIAPSAGAAPAMLIWVERAPPAPEPTPTPQVSAAPRLAQAKPKRATPSKPVAATPTVQAATAAPPLPDGSAAPTDAAIAELKPEGPPNEGPNEVSNEVPNEVLKEARKEPPKEIPKETPASADPPQANSPAPAPNPDVMAVAQSKQATWAVPPAPEVPTPTAPAPTPAPELPSPTAPAISAPSVASSAVATLPLPNAEDRAKERAVEQAKREVA